MMKQLMYILLGWFYGNNTLLILMVSRELCTGDIPYYNTPINDIISLVGYQRKQVALPTKGNSIILSIMKNCLNLDKKKRPTFKQIVEQLQLRNKSMLAISKKGKTWI